MTTFKTLCGLAAFDGEAPVELPVDQETPGARATTTPPATVIVTPPSMPPAPAININIQLQLPATGDADVYEKLFAALKKHLF